MSFSAYKPIKLAELDCDASGTAFALLAPGQPMRTLVTNYPGDMELEYLLECCGCRFSPADVRRLVVETIEKRQPPESVAKKVMQDAALFNERDGEALFAAVFALWNEQAEAWNGSRLLN